MKGAKKALLDNTVASSLLASGGPSRGPCLCKRKDEAAAASWPEVTCLQKFLQERLRQTSHLSAQMHPQFLCIGCWPPNDKSSCSCSCWD